MSKIDVLRRNYQRICGLPWDRHVAGPQRIWLAVYDKEDERRLRLRLGLFEETTRALGYSWHHLDLTDAFAHWLCSPPYADFAESYFAAPSKLPQSALAHFKKAVAESLRDAFGSLKAPDRTVVAVSGVASLFGFGRISEVLPLIEGHIPGRLLVFFPGTYENHNYRLLDARARDGWNYHAVPITCDEGGLTG